MFNHWKIGNGTVQFSVTYPIDSTVYTTPNAPTTNINTTSYIGHVVSQVPSILYPSNMAQNFGINTYSMTGITQLITVNGLKPNTIHNISIGDGTASVTINPVFSKPVFPNNGFGGPNYIQSSTTIQTDSTGSATFTVLLDNTTVTAIINKLLTASTNVTSGVVIVKLASYDATSNAVFNMTFDTSSTVIAPTPVGTQPVPVTAPLAIGGSRGGGGMGSLRSSRSVLNSF